MRYDDDLDVTQQREQKHRATAYVGLVLSNDSYLTDIADPWGTFRARGFGRYLPTKGANDSVLSTDPGVALLPKLGTAFAAQAEGESLIGQLDGAIRVPLNAGARLQVGTIFATEVGELAVKPISWLEFDTAGPGTKASALVVFSIEAMRSFDLMTQTTIAGVTGTACGNAVNTIVVGALTAGAPIASGTPADLLAAISDGQPTRPYLIGGYDMLLALAPGTLRELRDLGIGVLSSPAAAGQLIAVDAAGLLIAAGPIELQTARHANILMNSGGTPAGTTVVNLFQSNLLALRAEQQVRIAVRTGAAAWTAGTP